MNPASVIPTPDPLQVPWYWFHLLSTSTFFLHIILMNVMLGTIIITFIYQLINNEDKDGFCRGVAKKIPFTIAFTINFGVAPLLFIQVLYGQFFYTSSILMAVFWLSLIIVLILAYYLAYIYDYRFEHLVDGRIVLSGLITILLLWVTFMMCNNTTLMQNPENWFRYFKNPAGTLINLDDPTLIPRYLHYVVSAVAVGGLSIALYYEYKRRKGDQEAIQWIEYGSRWFSYATIINFGVGFWFLGILPPHVHDIRTLLGGLFGVSLFAAVVTAILSVINGLRFNTLAALYYTLATIFLMILARDLSRASYLDPWFNLRDLPVNPQYSPMILFFLVFAGGIFLVYRMLKMAIHTISNQEER